MTYKNSVEINLSLLKRSLPFLDETFVASTDVRRNTIVENAQILEELGLSNEKRMRIKSELRAIRIRAAPGRFYAPSQGSFHELQKLLYDANRKAREFGKIYTRIYPLSQKTIFQYRVGKEQLLADFFSRLPFKEAKQFMVFCNNQLEEYSPGIVPDKHVELKTRLKPYFSSERLTVDDVISTIETSILKAERALKSAQMHGQKQREKQAGYKFRKLNQARNILSRICQSFPIYARRLKGVESFVRLNQRAYPWPKYLLGNFRPLQRYSGSHGESFLNGHSVIVPQAAEVPVVAFENLFLFCEDVNKIFDIKNMLTPHEINKFRPFSHYELRMSDEYPLRNSIAFPFSHSDQE